MNSGEQQNNQENTFLSYNVAISKLKMIDETYSEETKEMCEFALYGVLAEVYNNKEIYHRVLEKMRENSIYERYAKVIFELQFNPPQIEQAANEGGSNSNQGENKPEQNNNQSNSNVATKPDDSKDITKRYIQDLFNNNDNFNL